MEKSKINSGRLARIIEQISEFDFKIEYKEGTSTIISVVDALSRLPRYRKVLDEEGEGAQQDVALCEVFGLDVVGEDSSDWGVSSLIGDTQLIQQIQEGYSEDEYFKEIKL